jgi:uncharacterized protein (TIGR03435 family)
VSETPTANAPGAEEKMAVTETEFEVADIKPSRADATPNARFQPNGRIDIQALPLKDMIKLSYNIDDDDRIVAPKWLESAKFDVVAKTSAAPPIDTLRLMLKALLIDRFRIQSHMEDRPVAVYAMTVGKRGSKLEKATGSERAGCKRGNENEMITWTCKNTTMAQLAEDLPRVAGGYIVHPAVDSTGLEGGYNFVISWTPSGRLNGGRGGRGGDAAPAAAPAGGGSGGAISLPADPTGLSMFEALDRQLGLKLDVTKKPMPVLVIDKVNQMPTEN